MLLSIAEIEIGQRRAVNAAKVQELADSIREVGLLNPITVTDDGQLVDGLHRIEAARALGWHEIEADLVTLDGLHAALAEINENLIRHGYATALEEAEAIAEREQLLAEFGLRAKVGRNRFTGIKLKTTADLAAEVGMSKRTYKKRKQIATSIPPDVRDAIRDTPLADRKTDLLRLARMPEDEQRQIAQQVRAGEISLPRAKAEDEAEAQPMPHVAHNRRDEKDGNEWYTPPNIIEAARRVMGGIDLDPTSSEIANRLDALDWTVDKDVILADHYSDYVACVYPVVV